MVSDARIVSICPSETRHAQHRKVWLEEKMAARVLATLASPPATCALAPVLSPSPKLHHVVYASVLHFGVEKAYI